MQTLTHEGTNLHGALRLCEEVSCTLGINKRELGLAAALAVAGFFFSERGFLNWLNTLTPIEGLIFYYVVLFISILALSKLGLVVGDVKFNLSTQAIGAVLILFAFFVVVDWTSAYNQYALTGVMPSANSFSTAYLQDEDGAAFYFWNVVSGFNPEDSRLLTFVLTPFLLASVGAALVTKKIRLGVF
jgi:hypothetical protein